MPPDVRARPGADRAGNYFNEQALGGGRLAPNLPHEAAAGPLVDLVSELRPDLPTAIVMSLVYEALDYVAGVVLDAEWASAREAMPGFRSRWRNLIPHTEQRLRQLADAQPRPGDYLGGPAHDRWVA